MLAPGYEEAKPISKPTVQPMLLPIIMAKVIPFAGSNTVPLTDREGIGKGYREKLDLSIQNKCIQGLWNDRGSVFTMSFKLNCTKDLETLKSMEKIYKEECHVHQFNLPFETAVWNESELPIRNSQSKTTPAGNENANPQQSNNSGLEVNTQQNTEQQNQTPIPQRPAQTPGGSLQPQ